MPSTPTVEQEKPVKYIDHCREAGLTEAQIASLYAPDTSPRSPLGRFRAAKAAGRNVTMTDVLSEIASGRRAVRYVDGRLVRL